MPVSHLLREKPPPCIAFTTSKPSKAKFAMTECTGSELCWCIFVSFAQKTCKALQGQSLESHLVFWWMNQMPALKISVFAQSMERFTGGWCATPAFHVHKHHCSARDLFDPFPATMCVGLAHLLCFCLLWMAGFAVSLALSHMHHLKKEHSDTMVCMLNNKFVSSL